MTIICHFHYLSQKVRSTFGSAAAIERLATSEPAKGIPTRGTHAGILQPYVLGTADHNERNTRSFQPVVGSEVILVHYACSNNHA